MDVADNMDAMGVLDDTGVMNGADAVDVASTAKDADTADALGALGVADAGELGGAAGAAEAVDAQGRCPFTSEHPVYDRFVALLPPIRRDRLALDEADEEGFRGSLPCAPSRFSAEGIVRKLMQAASEADPGNAIPQEWESSSRTLIEACVLLISLWFARKDLTIGGVMTLLGLADDPAETTALDLLFGEIERGEKYVRAEQAPGAAADAAPGDFVWVPTELVRHTDGRKPGEVVDGSRGLAPHEDAALGAYDDFRDGCPRERRRCAARFAIRLLSGMAREAGWHADRPSEEHDAATEAIGLARAGELDLFDKLYAAAILMHISDKRATGASRNRFESLLRERVACVRGGLR